MDDRPSSWIDIVGISEGGWPDLGEQAQTCIAQAQVLIGGQRHLQLVQHHNPDAEHIIWARPLSDTFTEIAKRQGLRVVVLASGDPLWYGVATTLGRTFGAKAIRVLPTVGAFSLAAAQLCWPIQEVGLYSVHGRSMARLSQWLYPQAKLLLLTRDGAQIGEIAQYLQELGYDQAQLRVLGALGGPSMADSGWLTVTGEIGEFADLNILAIEAGPAQTKLLGHACGLADEVFVHDGNLTKRSIRAVTLAHLRPYPGQCLWDLGAGCGSVAVEWLRGGGSRAFAVESKAARLAIIAQNKARFGLDQLILVEAKIEAALADLAPPDAIFIGGGLGTPDLIARCIDYLPVGGRLVANAVTLEAEAVLHRAWKQYGGDLELISTAQVTSLGRFSTRTMQLPIMQYSLITTQSTSHERE